MESLVSSSIITKYVQGFSFCRFLTEELRILSAIEPFDDGRRYTFIRAFFDILLGKIRGLDLTAISSMSGVDMVKHILRLDIEKFFAIEEMRPHPFAENCLSRKDILRSIDLH